MIAQTDLPLSPMRRTLIAGAVFWLAGWPKNAFPQEPAAPPVLMVSRTRVLKEARAARALQDAEDALSAQLQDQYDRVKEKFSAEEKELTALRPTLDRETFDARVADFDRRLRITRRRTQDRASELQKRFQSARLELVRALDPLLEQIRRERGALVILNIDNALAVDPSIDITNDVIALFNDTLSEPPIPEFGPFDIEAGIDPPAN